jgi:endoglucanase
MTNADVDKLLATGANCFRLLFTWEALQSSAYGDINAQVGNYKTYADTFFALVDYITSKGAKVLLDIHGGKDAGFAAYRDRPVGTLYNGQDVGDLLENVWWQLATKYRSNLNVLYGITNEPHDMDAAIWYTAAQKVVTGIRNAGATTRIYTPGVDWTGAGSWMTHNAPAYNIQDPLNNTSIQLHLYLDANAGGGATDIVSATIGSERCKQVTAWARSKGLKLFLAEVGLSATNPAGKPAWADLHAFLLANKDVWDGFTFWAAGPPAWWSGYQFYCGPGSAQLAMIQAALK